MISFLKTKQYKVKSPKFNIGNDAGIDFFIPEYSNEFNEAFLQKNPDKEISFEVLKDGTRKYYIDLKPHEDVNIPSGIYSKFAPNIALVALNKSGIATGKKLIFGAQVIDHSYQGIIHIHLINTSDSVRRLYLDEKAIQFVPIVIDISGVDVVEGVDPENWYEKVSERGTGAFGSTGLA